MAGKSTWLQNAILDFLFRGQKFPPSTGVGPISGVSLYVALYTNAPNDTTGATGGTEVAGSIGYARKAVTLTMAGFWPTQGAAGAGTASSGSTSPGVIANATSITFGDPTAAWGTIVAFGLVDSGPTQGTAGNLWFWGMLNPAKTIAAGDSPPSFAAGTLQISED
jgi:hypothetical protein